MKPTTPAQREATIDDVRSLLDGDPLDAVSLYRGHLAMVLGALDEARRERDEAKSHAEAMQIERDEMRANMEFVAGEARQAIASAERERDEAQAALVRAQEYAMRGDAKLAEQATRLASEPARIAAAEMARDVAWVRAIEACGGNSARYVQYVFNVPGYYDAARVQYAANHGEDIAAAIRAARGQS